MDYLECTKSIYNFITAGVDDPERKSKLEISLNNLNELNTNFIDFGYFLSKNLNIKHPSRSESSTDFFRKCITLLQRKKKLEKLMK